MGFARGFFSKETLKQQEERSFINVGKKKFDALAVALIDSLLDTPRGNDAALKKILERFYQYFPKYVSNQPYLTLPERMGVLLNSPRKSELVVCMAYVLRQLTLERAFAHPLQHRELFAGFSPDTEKNYLRNPETELPDSALNALAQELGISITLSYKEPGKELRKRVEYSGKDSAKPGLLLQVQGDQYFPNVKHKADFIYVGQLAVSAPKPVEKEMSGEADTLADIINLIAEDNKMLVQSYNMWRKKISSMVAANELSYAQLMEFYISFLPVQSISEVEQSEKKPLIAGFPEDREKKMIDLLSTALADGITTKQIPDPEGLFDQLENHGAAAPAA